MNITQTFKTKLRQEIEERMAMIAKLDNITVELPDDFPEPVCYAGQIDFDNLSHPNIIALIQAVGGKWKKTPSGVENKIDYETTLGDIKVRCWAGEPPPSCKLIEYDVELPAQPAQIVKRYKLECIPKTEPELAEVPA